MGRPLSSSGVWPNLLSSNSEPGFLAARDPIEPMVAALETKPDASPVSPYWTTSLTTLATATFIPTDRRSRKQVITQQSDSSRRHCGNPRITLRESPQTEASARGRLLPTRLKSALNQCSPIRYTACLS